MQPNRGSRAFIAITTFALLMLEGIFEKEFPGGVLYCAAFGFSLKYVWQFWRGVVKNTLITI